MPEKQATHTEKKLADMANPAWIKALVEHSPHGVFAINDQQQLIFVNPTLCTIFGYREEELLGQNFQMFLTATSLDLVTENYKKRQRGEAAPATYQFGIRRKNGEERRVEVSGNVMRDEHDHSVTIGNMIDISRRHKAEAELAQQERKSRTLLDGAQDAIFLHRLVPEGFACFSEVNQKAVDRYGYSRDEFLSLSVVDITVADGVTQYNASAARQRLLKGQSVLFEVLNQKKSGETFPVEISSTVIHFDGQPYILSHARDISKRKVAEQALLESEEKYRLIFDESIIGMAVADARSGIISTCNTALARMMGYSITELVGQPQTILHPASSIQGNFSKSFAQHRGVRAGEIIPEQFLTKAGGLIDVEIKANKITLGGREMIVGFVQNVTEQRKALATIVKQKETAQLYLDVAGVMLGALNRQGEIILMNKKGHQIFGYPEDTLIGRNWFEACLPAENRAEAKQVFSTLMTGELTPLEFYENTVLTKTGERRMIAFHNTLLRDDEEVSGLLFSGEDITERKQLETDQQNLLAAINQSEDSIIITDAEALIQYVNPAFAKLTGYSAAEALGQNPRILQSGEHDEAFYREMWAALTDGQPWKGRIHNKTKNGVRYTEEATITPVFTEPDRVTHYVAVKRDITEQLRHEAQLRQQHKMEAVGDMAGGIAHNFNNSLSIILGNLELIQMKQPVGSEVITYLENAKLAVRRSRDLVQKLMAYSRQDPQDIATIALAATVDEAIRLLRPTLPTTINLQQKYSSDCDKCRIQADPSQIQEILLNLCNNAVHAMEEKGELTLALQPVDLQQSKLPAQYDRPSGCYAQLSIQDDGCGMTTEIQERIFDPFFTTKAVNEGTGMGLSTVQGIVTQYGGFISVTSSPGQGTTFALYFPVVEGAGTTAAPTEWGQAEPGGTEQILLVDDDELLVTLGEELLKGKGYQVTVMTDSHEALKLFAANAERIDLLITDQTMPGLTGVELIQEVKKIKPNIPTILCTGHSTKVDEKSARQQGIGAFLLKPWEIPQLLQTVRQVLEGKQGQQP